MKSAMMAVIAPPQSWVGRKGQRIPNRYVRECYRIEMPGEEQMNNSPRLSHYLGGFDESGLFVTPVVERRAENPSAENGQREHTTHVDKNTTGTFWSRSAPVSKSMTEKDASDWKGNHHEIASHFFWHQQRQHSSRSD
jgi:hypothetical protein